MSRFKRERKKLLLELCLLGAIALIGASASAQEPNYGGTITVGLFNDATTIDPGTSTNVPAIRVRNMVYETLLAWDRDTNLMPMLADSYDVSEDGMIYTFHLRDDVKFHDGSDFDSSDVIFTFERILDVSPRSSNLTMIAGFEAPDAHTVRFELTDAASGPIFLQSVAMWFTQITPKEHTEAQLAAYGEIIEPVGTGPYMVEEWRRGLGITLVRFDDYNPRTEEPSGLAGAKIAYLDRIEYEVIKDPQIRIISLLQGDIDYAQQIPPEEVARLRSEDGLVVESVPGTNWSAVWFNVEKSPTDNLQMRQAIAAAIDYEELNEAVFQGTATLNNALIPRSQGAWRTEAHEQGYELDLERVSELLAEAGYAGEPVVFETRNEPIYDLIGQTLQEQLRRAGITLELNTMESAAHSASLYIRSSSDEVPSWNMGLLVSHAFRPDPDMHYYTRGHSTEHIGYWANEEYDQIVELARETRDPEERRELYARAHQIHIEEVPFIVLFNEPYIDAYRTNLHGVQVLDPHFDIFWGVWLGN